MMEQSKKYLSDILMAIDLIEKFTVDVSDFNAYDNDLKTQSAVERQLAIIGEALNRLRKIDTDLKNENAKKIIGFRNKLIHAYDSIDNSIVWVILNRHLNNLKNEVQAFEL